MPEYLAPGVFVEEVSYRNKSIEGTSTTTTGFVGPTRYGPLRDPLEVITSLTEFELAYGDREPLVFGTDRIPNFMWQAARAFFEEGGKRLYVKRIYNGAGGAATGVYPKTGGAKKITINARHPGEAGNLHVRFTLAAGQNVLASQTDPSTAAAKPVVRGLSDGDVVVVTKGGATPTATDAMATSYLDTATGAHTWRFKPESAAAIELSSLDPTKDKIEVVTLAVSVFADQPGALPAVWAGLPLDPQHRLAGARDSLAATFDAGDPAARGTPITIDLGTNATGLDVLKVFSDLHDHLHDADPAKRSADVVLTGGSDGNRPTPSQYEGSTEADDSKLGLVAFEDIDDISIVAAPGSTYGYTGHETDANQVINSLIIHAQRMRYRIAVIDSGDKQPLSSVRAMRAKFDSSYAAFYYPWITILDPATGQEANMPPSGFVAGIYARNDVQRAVYKAPANEVVNLAIGFERLLNKGQQEVLNPEGINCFRYFPGRGYRLWGARTMSSDPEWKYVNLRRYFAFLEHSIDRGTQWAVFEPNGEALWANVRGTVDDFLFDQWQRGAMLGDKAEKAYFVRCDRSTMTQNDLDNGRLVCLIGVAALRPAEFVIFRIGQWTADAKR